MQSTPFALLQFQTLSMVSGSRIEGGTQILSARVRKTIQSIKEIVGNHSDADIYVALKETNMDPNETTQKLLNQDPFHEVKRRRDKKKENTGYNGSAEPRKYSEHVGQGMKFNSAYADRNVRRGGYSRNALAVAGISREFRVVRDNRINQNVNREPKPPLLQCSTSTNEQVTLHVSEKGSSAETSSNQKPSGGHYSSQALDGPTDSHPRQARDANSAGTVRKELSVERRAPVPNTVSRVHANPVHVPSLDSRSAATVGAIKREVGAVGVRRQSSENSVKPSSAQSSSFSNSHLGRDGHSSRESFRPFTAISRSDQPSQSTITESVTPSMSPYKEWKPKSSQKARPNSPGVIGTPPKSVPLPAESPNDLETEATQFQDKPSQSNNQEHQNVIIAEHIRVSETDRCRLTFGSFGTQFDSSRNFESGSQAVGSVEESSVEPSTSLSGSAPESSSDETSGRKHVDLLEDQVRNSGSNSPLSGAMSEHQLPDKRESSSPQNLDNYADIGLVQDNDPSYSPSESQQQQDPPELSSFSAYDPQTGYDIPYFRPTMDETVRGQGLPSPQEALSLHAANSIPASTIAMVQQQQPQVAQMYPQVHVPHFANLLPYRQFLSPVYVPPMPMPGYSSNPTYPHPSNGSSYLLMPGGSSHLSASGLKYGIQQFKPVPAGSPTGFGNFTSPTGYAINAPGVVGSATGIEDSSWLKYKDNNLYVPSQQAETSEIRIQNPRELPSLQPASYYNMPGQTPHAAYMPSHTGHASFNAAAAAAAQSSHMQFPGLYHPPPQPAAIANPHHLGPTMGGSVGVGVAAAAPGPQVGAYQQPQLGHLNWTTNF
ncbi:hypothetical protein F0562_022803 [Nyssa sinensis]|uniref:GBF-interacting protein 1 N-terminal domain-containing protein n=1 Tax=Nyssa sinensis TaxID=561372 RepID=A0A5J5BKG1_9ASTE|nr:hypothetical protein F0562_022803 [Nyssa sinensis]